MNLRDLPPKRRAFVLAYVGEAKGNGAEAARIAGYAKPRHEAARLLANADIAAIVESFAEETTETGILTAIECQQILSGIATGVIGEPETNLAGEVVGDKAPRIADRIAAIKQLSKMRGYDAPKKVEHSEASTLPAHELLPKLEALLERVRAEVIETEGKTIESKRLGKEKGE